MSRSGVPLLVQHKSMFLGDILLSLWARVATLPERSLLPESISTFMVNKELVLLAYVSSALSDIAPRGFGIDVD